MSTNNGGGDPAKNRENMQEVAREAYRQADNARREAVKQMFEVADSIRGRARNLEGDARQNADKVARNLEQTANYINGRAVDQVEDATETMRENVWKTTLAVFVLGVLIGILLSRGD